MERTSGKAGKALTACVAQCLTREAAGRTGGSCSPEMTDADPMLQQCIGTAVAQATGVITDKCSDHPECLDSPAGIVPLVTEGVKDALHPVTCRNKQ